MRLLVAWRIVASVRVIILCVRVARRSVMVRNVDLAKIVDGAYAEYAGMYGCPWAVV